MQSMTLETPATRMEAATPLTGRGSVSAIDSSVDMDVEFDVEAEDSGRDGEPGEEIEVVEGGGQDVASSGAPWSRIARNINTFHYKDYATFVNNPKFSNVKVVL